MAISIKNDGIYIDGSKKLDYENVDAKTLQGKEPDAFASKEHTHEISEVSNLQDELDNKSDVGHGHEIADINNLQNALNNKSDVGHTHDDRYYIKTEVDDKLNFYALKTELIKGTKTNPATSPLEITTRTDGYYWFVVNGRLELLYVLFDKKYGDEKEADYVMVSQFGSDVGGYFPDLSMNDVGNLETNPNGVYSRFWLIDTFATNVNRYMIESKLNGNGEHSGEIIRFIDEQSVPANYEMGDTPGEVSGLRKLYTNADNWGNFGGWRHYNGHCCSVGQAHKSRPSNWFWNIGTNRAWYTGIPIASGCTYKGVDIEINGSGHESSLNRFYIGFPHN